MQWRTQEWGAAGLQPPTKPLQNRNLKNTYFVDIMISKVLRDLHFSRNQTLKSADDQYIRILKKKLIKLKNTREWVTVIGSRNMQLYWYVCTCRCRPCYVVLTA
jgi:hypothetical protein